ncbi:recombinase family protein [Mucilaginibacter gotjawali]|uniref:recombinase family protein n=1 Tax=Mucilaginibacter gotjawali TaxID=1550579 RepID=UPI000BBAEE28|nr:recombinase family protein [Mucilaginibacter gotjawali]
MLQADLYVRVSTDEQADKGYSIRSQEEVLRKYCNLQNIKVRKVVNEDYSAKTFNRPAWTEMLNKFRREKGKAVDLLLFTKWDRFSRNAGDAYQMINILRKIGIDPQAVEQPLDLSIPENKMMLAFYLAAPEVENDRRALNTFYGMRRARKEGRYLTTGPYGYVNRTTEFGAKTIVPIEPKASLVKWAFEQIAKGEFAIDQVRKELNKRGLKCSKSHFYTLVQNPVYYGKIVVPEYRDEPRQLVQGLHEPIVSEELFYEVQDVLNGRKRTQLVKYSSLDNLPLRGYLVCPKCGKQLTGSASKGRKDYYYYYHCIAACGVRYKAESANGTFLDDLKKFIPKPGMSELFKYIVNDVYSQQSGSQMDCRKDLLNRIQAENDRLAKARKLLLDETIDSADYKSIKGECETKLLSLEAKLTGFGKSTQNIESLLNQTIDMLSRLDNLYLEGNTALKREIIGSIYPEKLVFDGFTYRTTRVNEAARLIFLINSELYSKKNRTNLDFSKLSCSVAGAGLEPTTFGL